MWLELLLSYMAGLSNGPDPDPVRVWSAVSIF